MPKVFRILLVEDNVDDEELTLRSLRKLGPQVQMEVARDGKLALERLFDGDQPMPNLILLDLHLPRLGGIQVLEQLRANVRTEHVLVVVLTSSDEPAVVRATYQELANGYIHKPVSLKEFSEVVQRLGANWQDTNLDPG